MANQRQPERQNRGTNTNPDPITGAPGAHPVGTGVGAAGGGAMGAAVGTAAGGPVGGLAGAAIGAVAGGLAGKGAAEAFDPTVELEYWRDAHVDRPYYNSEFDFDAYEPAYRYGWESRARMMDKDWDAAEQDLKRNWMKSRERSNLTWENAKDAVRDAWDRVTGDDRTPPRKRR